MGFVGFIMDLNQQNFKDAFEAFIGCTVAYSDSELCDVGYTACDILRRLYKVELADPGGQMP